jgi:alginate O-acetyltransferase complex protein AlgI
MSFISFEFAFFFVAVILLRSCFRDFKSEKWFLIGTSCLFVASWSITTILLLLLVSLVAYLVGLGFTLVEDERRRSFLLVISIGANLGVLFVFKYTSFLLDNVWWILNSFGIHMNRWQYEIILPVGISFFTFIAMTYVIDIYWGNIRPHRSLQDVFLFIGYFPQILSGPINRAVEMMPQLKQRVRATALEFESGLAQFGMGAIKKNVISDQIAPHVSMIFAAPGGYDGLTLLQGLLGYTVQIYCDFSGYSDMAIGCARMMGYRFRENFQMPYSAVNITEFWRRWHISLSGWFRDYLYIPLGGNRKGLVRTYANLILTMLLCGFWHGASWNFVFWGGLHGGALAMHRAWKSWAFHASLRDLHGFRLLSNFFSRVSTLSVVLIGWLFFRADSWSNATEYLERLVTWNGGGIRMLSPYIIAAVTGMVLVHLLIKKDRNWMQEITQLSVPVRILSYTSMLLLIVCLGATDSAPFIYFQF